MLVDEEMLHDLLALQYIDQVMQFKAISQLINWS